MRRNLAISAAAAVVGLWAHGRYRRSTWTTTPTVRCIPHEGDATRTAIFVLTGAFNGPAHTERIINEHWVTKGDVYVMDYPLRRFDMGEAVHAGASHIEQIDTEYQYDTIVLDGYSLGGLISLLILARLSQYNPQLADKIQWHPSDTPLGPQHLLIPGGKPIPPAVMKYWLRIAPQLRHVHVGPLFNLPSRLITKVFFVPMDEEDREEGMDADQFKRHMAFLRANKLSVIVEQIAGIASQQPIKGRWSNKASYRRCGNDLVIDADASYQAARDLFPNLQLVNVGDCTSHVTLVEMHAAYLAATQKAFES